MEKRRFKYDGPILFYNNVVDNNWKAITYAETKRRAISNLKYQANRYLGKTEKNKISLPGNIVEE